MSIRVLLALLIVLALAASLGISIAADTLLAAFPEAAKFFAWLSGPVSPTTIVSVTAAAIISVIFFILVNALIVRPLRAICRAMDTFANGGEHAKLPAFKGSPAEIRNFAHIWSEFASRVEGSHARDVEVSRVKSDFISTAAHQLRTPLTGIRWALEALEKEPLTESQMQLIKSAVDKSHDLVGIVGTLLDISSIESGKYKYQFVPYDLETLVTEVATDFLPLAERSGVILTYAPVGNLPKVRIDHERMKWVLNNLIENAVRYTPQGGSVTLTTVAVSGRVMVRVRDTGIGIAAQDRNNIFERFYRAGNAVTKENQGNGLGLYIARTIVNDHRGELSFEANTDGAGTTFTLALPSA